MLILGAFLRRDWGINRSYRLQLVTYAFGAVTDIVLFFFVGRFVDYTGVGSESILRHGYFSFVFVGLVVSRLSRSVLTSFQSSLQQEQMSGTLEAVIATPPNTALLIVANPVYSLTQVVVTQAVMTAIALRFLGLSIEGQILPSLYAAMAIVACVVLFAALGLGIAGITLVVKRGSGVVSGLILSGMALLGGIYYPVDVLPFPLRILALCFPFTWALQVIRAALFDGTYLVGSMVMLVAVATAAVPLAVWFFRISLDRARREGSLIQY